MGGPNKGLSQSGSRELRRGEVRRQSSPITTLSGGVGPTPSPWTIERLSPLDPHSIFHDTGRSELDHSLPPFRREPLNPSEDVLSLRPVDQKVEEENEPGLRGNLEKRDGEREKGRPKVDQIPSMGLCVGRVFRVLHIINNSDSTGEGRNGTRKKSRVKTIVMEGGGGTRPDSVGP